MNTTESSMQRFQSSRGVSILSCTEHDRDHEHDHHTATRLEPTRKGLALGSHITLDVTAPSGSRQEPTVHWGPFAGRPWVARKQVTTYDTTSDDSTTRTWTP